VPAYHCAAADSSATDYHGGKPVSSLRSSKITTFDEPICKHLVPVFGEDGLRVELHTLNQLLAVPQPHDHAGFGPGRDLELSWDGVVLDRKGVISRRCEG